MNSDYGNDTSILVPGFIRGYRAWKIFDSSARLRSFTQNIAWRPGHQMKARCRTDNLYILLFQKRVPHKAPDPECSCGIYARHIDDNHGYSLDGICGVIKATGRIVLGTAGFRAQYAEIEAFYLDPKIMDGRYSSEQYRRRVLRDSDIKWAPTVLEAAERLAEKYQVPLLARQEVFEQYPRSDVSELLRDQSRQGEPA